MWNTFGSEVLFTDDPSEKKSVTSTVDPLKLWGNSMSAVSGSPAAERT